MAHCNTNENILFQSSSTSDTSMGAIGLSVTGGVFYNHLSSTDGSLALANEGTTLDSCFGHSDAVSIYYVGIFLQPSVQHRRLAGSSQ